MTDSEIEKRLGDIEYYHSLPNEIRQDDFDWLYETCRRLLKQNNLMKNTLEYCLGPTRDVKDWKIAETLNQCAELERE